MVALKNSPMRKNLTKMENPTVKAWNVEEKEEENAKDRKEQRKKREKVILICWVFDISVCKQMHKNIQYV